MVVFLLMSGELCESAILTFGEALCGWASNFTADNLPSKAILSVEMRLYHLVFWNENGNQKEVALSGRFGSKCRSRRMPFWSW